VQSRGWQPTAEPLFRDLRRQSEPNMAPPIIGLTLDHEPGGGWSKFPWYAIRENYCAAVRHAGGLPVLLPHEPDAAELYLDHIDGLVVTGGGFDVDPALFGAASRHPTVTTKDRRTAFELAATRGALGRDMPVLGICGGQQLLNVVLGGTLIQHIPDEVPDALPHRQSNPRNEAGHDVRIVEGTLLHRIAGTEWLGVNSAHHQAVKDAGPGVIIDAVARDGVIEGIEDPCRRFCLGIQWHPEFEINEADRRIFGAFVEAARR
jgi:putative glutamine amidotransferase